MKDSCDKRPASRIPREAGFSGIHRNCLFCGNTATVSPTAYFFCCARKSRQKDALEDASYCALTRANFWPLRGLNALFGRRIATVPIAFGSAECTTRSYGQTTSISLLLISGIPNQLISMYSRMQILCTTGECVGGLLFPRQRVLPSPYVATASDWSVVSTQAAL